MDLLLLFDNFSFVISTNYLVTFFHMLETNKKIRFNFDKIAERRKILFFVIPVEAGIQSFQMVIDALDPGFHRSDNFLRSRQL